MIRRPPRSTRTDTLFPYTTLFRSLVASLRRIGLTVENGFRYAHLPPDERAAIERGVADGLAIIREKTRHLGTLSGRSEEHTSELQSLMRISYAVFCLKKKNKTK